MVALLEEVGCPALVSIRLVEPNLEEISNATRKERDILKLVGGSGFSAHLSCMKVAMDEHYGNIGTLFGWLKPLDVHLPVQDACLACEIVTSSDVNNASSNCELGTVVSGWSNIGTASTICTSSGSERVVGAGSPKSRSMVTGLGRDASIRQ